MLIVEHLKTFPHVSIIILIIFRELVGSLLKSLNLKFLKFKVIKVDCGDAATCCSITTIDLYDFKNFRFSDFNKELTNSLKMIRIKIETCWIVFKCFNINILD